MVDYSFGTVQDGSITTAKLANDAVTSDKVAPDTIIALDIAANGVGDSEIAAHTSSKITINAKAQLIASILYNDQNNDLGAFYADIAEIVAPAAPALGKSRIYRDSADGKLKRKNSAGAVQSLEESGGATVTTQESILAATFTTTSATYVDTALSITLANRTGGRFMSVATLMLSKSATFNARIRYTNGGVSAQESLIDDVIPSTESNPFTTHSTGTLNGNIITIQAHSNGVDTFYIISSVVSNRSWLSVFEAS